MAASSHIISCKPLSSGAVLAMLYNNSKPLGMGVHAYDPTPMTAEVAEEILAKNPNPDYCKGRPIKTNFAFYPILDSRSFDRNNGGTGTMKKLVSHLQKTGDVSHLPSSTTPSEKEEEEEEEESLYAVANPSFSSPDYGAKVSTSFPKTVQECGLAKFDHVWFTAEFCEDNLSDIPYSDEWFVYKGTDHGIASFAGSVCGGFVVDETVRCVKRHAAAY